MDEIERRQGHFLPHWTANDGTYFVTFRLADSMPPEVVRKFEEEYRQLLRLEEQALRRKLRSEEIKKTKNKLRKKLETYLDAGYGECHLARPECALVVKEALQFFDSDRYGLGAWAVMPNHVHAIVQPFDGHDLEKIVKSWKSFTSRKINELVGRSGALWQSEPFDHLIRNGASFCRFTKYVLDNPRAAGFSKLELDGSGNPREWRRGGRVNSQGDEMRSKLVVTWTSRSEKASFANAVVSRRLLPSDLEVQATTSRRPLEASL